MKEKFWNSLRTFVLVAVVTCLIWVYADQITSETTQETVTLGMTFPAGVLAEVESPKQGRFDVKFSGPRAQIEKLRRELSESNFRLATFISSVDAQTNVLVREAKPILVAQLSRRFPGVSVQSCEPAEIRIALDRWVQQKMPVRVLCGSVETTDPVCDPREVEVTITQSALDQLSPSEREVKVDVESELRESRDDQIDREFAVSQFIGDVPVSTNPTHVRIRLRIRRRYEVREFDVGRIGVLAPTDLLSRYRVEIIDKPRKVFLRGSAEQLAKFRKDDMLPYIIIEQSDTIRALNQIFSREVQFRLPEGISVDPQSTRPLADFRLTEVTVTEKPK